MRQISPNKGTDKMRNLVENYGSINRGEWVIQLLGALSLLAAIIIWRGLLLWLAWNYALTPVTHIEEINFTVALVLSFVSIFLF